MENKNNEAEIDLLELFYAVKKRFLIIVAVGILFAGIAGAYTHFMIAPTYQSTATVLVLSKETTLTSIADLQLGTYLANDYEILITSRQVLEKVIKKANLDMSYQALEGKISINNPEGTRILELTVTDTDPARAKKIVDELAEVSSEYIGDKMEVIPPKVIEEGEAHGGQIGPNMKRNVLLGLLLGLAFSGGIVVLLTLMDDSIKTEDDISKYLGTPTLASVPDRKDYIGKKNRKNKRGGGR